MSQCLSYQSVYLDSAKPRYLTKLHLITLLLLVTSFSYKVWLKLEAVDVGYQIAESRKEMVALDIERQELELQYSVITRPDVLINEAQNKLELFAPAAFRIVRILE